MNAIQKKVILIKNIIFDKNKTWNREQIQFFSQNIRKLNKAIEIIKVFQEEILEKTQLKNNLKLKLTLAITRQDHIAKTLEKNHIIENFNAEKQAKNKKQHWVQNQDLILIY